MGVRRKGREYAIQSLYLADVTHMELLAAHRRVMHELILDKPIKQFADKLVEGLSKSLTTIDDEIRRASANWDFNRIAAIDRNILRLGIYEMIYETDTPLSVIMNEAVELAKTFSTDDSSSFVNGILDKLKTLRTK